MRRVKPQKEAPRAGYPRFARLVAWLWPAGALAAAAAHADASLPVTKRGPGAGNIDKSISRDRSFRDLVNAQKGDGQKGAGQKGDGQKGDGQGVRGRRPRTERILSFDDIVVTGGVVARVVPVDATPPPPPEAKPPRPEARPGDQKPCPLPPAPPSGNKRPQPPILGGKMVMPQPPDLSPLPSQELPPKEERVPPPPRPPEPPAQLDPDLEDPFPETVWLHPHGVDEPCHRDAQGDDRLLAIRVPPRAKEA